VTLEKKRFKLCDQERGISRNLLREKGEKVIYIAERRRGTSSTVKGEKMSSNAYQRRVKSFLQRPHLTQVTREKNNG